jgi:hypothetical protein
LLLGLGHFLRLTRHEFHAASRTFCVTAAGMQLIDLRIFLECEHQSLTLLYFEFSDPFDRQLWHENIPSLVFDRSLDNGLKTTHPMPLIAYANCSACPGV